VVVAIKPGGKGEITDSHVLWTQTRFLPYVPSPLFAEDHLYMIKNGGILACIDCKTGNRVKEARIPNTQNYYSSPVTADGKIYLISQNGALTVLSAEPQWKVLATAEFGEDAFATPAIGDGRIYLRTAGHLYCFGLR
jgi:outer membrane protein assembly factor BamB